MPQSLARAVSSGSLMECGPLRASGSATNRVAHVRNWCEQLDSLSCHCACLLLLRLHLVRSASEFYFSDKEVNIHAKALLKTATTRKKRDTTEEDEEEEDGVRKQYK